MTWRIDKRDVPTGSVPGAVVLLSIMECQRAWRQLSKAQRAAVLAADDKGWLPTTVNARTVYALRRHGIVAEVGWQLTPAGWDVRKYRPLPTRVETARTVLDDPAEDYDSGAGWNRVADAMDVHGCAAVLADPGLVPSFEEIAAEKRRADV